jgi:hypothetical protein
MKTTYPWNIRARNSITIGDLCEALSDGVLPARIEDGNYVFSRRDLQRFAEGQTLRQSISDQAAIEQLLHSRSVSGVPLPFEVTANNQPMALV